MKIFAPIFTGLGTQPVGMSDEQAELDPTADCGMLGFCGDMMDQNQGHDWQFPAYGWDNKDPDDESREILAEYHKFQPDLVIYQGHSFGGAFLNFFANWLATWHAGEMPIDLAIFYDPCKNPRFGGSVWSPPVKRYVCHYQQGGRPFGVSGTPFINEINGTNIDVTSWRDPTLAHISIFGWTGIILDTRVRSRCLQEAAKVIAAKAGT